MDGRRSGKPILVGPALRTCSMTRLYVHIRRVSKLNLFTSRRVDGKISKPSLSRKNGTTVSVGCAGADLTIGVSFPVNPSQPSI